MKNEKEKTKKKKEVDIKENKQLSDKERIQILERKIERICDHIGLRI